LPGAPVDDVSLARWTLAWPLAHEAVLTAAAAAQGVPPQLLWGLAREESAFDESIASWAGAVGLCQLMPATAREEAGLLGLPRPTSADLTDPVLNARLGASHLGRRLRGMGHPLKAIAAYNAGPGSVAKWMPPSGQHVPVDYWVEQIPYDETRNYVKYVTGSWVTYALLYGGDDIAYPLDIVGR
jgi:soluble lytic murein transglycosylase